MQAKNPSKTGLRAVIVLALVLAISLIIVPSSEAANTWDGGSLVDSNWNTAENWDTNTVPAFPVGLTFGGSTRLDPFNNLVGPTTVNGFTFAAGAGAFTLSGNPITLAGNITNSSTNTQTINLDMVTTAVRTINLSSNAVTLGGKISGSGGFTTTGAASGIITLSGSNTFSGGVSMTSGTALTTTLNIGHAKALGTGLLSLNAGNSGGNRIDNTSGTAMTIANDVSLLGGFSAVQFLGTNDLTINGTLSNSQDSNNRRSIQVDANTLTLAGNVYLAADNTGERTLKIQGAGNLTIEGVVSNNSGAGGFAGGISVIDSATLQLLNDSNTYTGSTTFAVNDASPTLVVTKLANGGVASSLGASSNVAANLVVGDVRTQGTLRYIGSGDSTDRLFTIAQAGGVLKIESSGSGALHFTNPGDIAIPGTSGSGRTLELGGTYTGGENTMASNVTGDRASLRKEGAGTWNLTNANGYAQITTVNAGTLLVSGTGSINASSAIAVNGSGSKFSYTSSTGLTRPVTLATGGGFFHSGSTDYSGTLTWTNGVVGGTNWNGAKLNNLTVNANRTISPGNSPGTALTANQTWGTDGSYIWEINDVAGTAGADPGWDLVSGTGSLTISATSSNKFTIYVTSLTLLNAPGDAANFNSATNYQWKIADFANPVSGFSADKFAINASGFSNVPGSIFSVVLGNDPSITGGDNSQIYLTYAAIPEPNTALLLGVGIATVLLRRRRAE